MARQHIAHALEIALSALILAGLFYVAFFVKPSVEVPDVRRSAIEPRDNFYGVASPGDDGAVVWAAGRAGKIIRSDDGGEHWRAQETPVFHHIQDIAAWDADTAVAAGDQGTVLITQDGGGHWRSVDAPTRPRGGSQFLRVRIDTQGRAWITGTMGVLLVSGDNGRSWRLTHPKQDIGWNDVTVAPDGTVWLVGEFGTIKRSGDGGASWQAVDSPTDSSLMSVTFSDTDHAVAVGLSGTVLTTSDGGAHWQRRQAGTGAHLFDVAWDGARYLAVGNGGVLVTGSADGGSWKAGSIAPGDFGWYTEVTPVAGHTYITGQTLGTLADGRWRAFRGRPAPGNDEEASRNG
ncbi:YCF48-related protein [Arhodomonas aquaeolei]|uniref:WD40/YVTN/BNR-like repeat-containing protein n=1 Tax=Arhodomonas aquaeolei TaxID=2369 RepID=UPI002168DF2E|nr:YCF48-related protein [Arhodomonas aquaeolei]MCS4505514.1 YCF48-related protein [Arhodomonas aquaeolei]